MPRKVNKQNLAPPFTSGEKAREMGRRGGIKSGEAKRVKKLLSEIYADALSAHEADINKTIARLITRGDASSVSILKEIREATEGSKLKTEGTMTIIIDNQDDNL